MQNRFFKSSSRHSNINKTALQSLVLAMQFVNVAGESLGNGTHFELDNNTSFHWDNLLIVGGISAAVLAGLFCVGYYCNALHFPCQRTRTQLENEEQLQFVRLEGEQEPIRLTQLRP